MNKRIEYIIQDLNENQLYKQTFEALKDTIEEIYKKEQDISPVIHQLQQNGFVFEKVIMNHHQERTYHLFRIRSYSHNTNEKVMIVIEDLPAATCRIGIQIQQDV